MNFAAKIYESGARMSHIPYLNGREFQDFIRHVEPVVRGKDFKFNERIYFCHFCVCAISELKGMGANDFY